MTEGDIYRQPNAECEHMKTRYSINSTTGTIIKFGIVVVNIFMVIALVTLLYKAFFTK